MKNSALHSPTVSPRWESDSPTRPFPGSRSRKAPASILSMRTPFPSLYRVGLALALASISTLACDDPPPEPGIRPVRSIVVGDPAQMEAASLPGRAKAVQELDLAFEVSGQLIERPVKVGDRVMRGQLLARLDPRDYDARLSAARGRYSTALANFRRAKKLVAEEALAEIVLDQRRAVMDTADGQLRQAEKALADTQMLAPFDGTVAVTYSENFENVLAKQAVVRLLDMTQIEMLVDVPESAIGLSPWVTDIEVRFDALPDRVFHATIKEIGAEASRMTRTYPVTLVIVDADEGLLPGMAGRAFPQVELPDDLAVRGIEVPQAAIFSPPGEASQKSYVWIVGEGPRTVSMREVEIVSTTPSGVRVSGIKPGERVVTAGVHSLDEGREVRLFRGFEGSS